MTQAIFKFKSNAAGGDQFTVVSFTGFEAISNLYRYEIELKAPVMAEIDLDDVLDATATFITDQDGIEYPVHGVLSSFEEVRFVQNYSYYKAILVPRIWKLSNYKTNEIYYKSAGVDSAGGGQCIDNIIHQVLEKANISSSDYDIDSLQGSLLKREYVCQYNESDFDFISRLMENEGVFYYFEQGEVEEKIIFINDLNYLSIQRPKLLFDVAAQAKNQDDCVYAISCRKQRLPENVIVRDYNPDEASLDVSDITTIDNMGQGTEYIYGKNVKSDSEATYLSQIRAEEYICRKTVYFGESSVTRLLAGHIFVLDGHPNTSYNAFEYLTVEVHHEGTSLDMSLAGTGDKNTKPQYQNNFIAIPADVQYRPPRKTEKPRITGTIHARIDGELNSKYAQLDDQGRYKVSLPFDFHNEEHPEGLASARVRMMQPYAGENRGMQFPMAKGTEVLLSFIDGDPDRPIIAGAINSVSAPGPVNADNQTESVIQTGGNNKIRMEDKPGSERVILESPASNSWLRIGATNDPIILNGSSPLFHDKNNTYADLGAITHPDDNSAGVAVSASEITNPSGSTTDSSGAAYTNVDNTVEGVWSLKYVNGTDTAIRKVVVNDPADDDATEELSGTINDGIRIRSGGNLWLEAQSRYGNYFSGKPPFGPIKSQTDVNAHPQIGDLIANFGDGYNPTGLKNRVSESSETFTAALAAGHVHVSSLDTFTTQEGNIYDFGGYWNYNLGNSYAEDHVDQAAELNKNATDFNNAQTAYKDAKREVERLRSWNDPSDDSLQYYPDLVAAENLKTSTKATRDGLTDIKGDLLDAGGPGWNSVNWPTATPKVGNQDTTDSDNRFAQGADGGISINNDLTAGDTMLEGSYWTNNQDEGAVWVQKKWGNDYEYHQGDAISVSVGSSLDVQHGGRHVEVSYRGDDESTISSWSCSEGGVTREKKWTSAGTMIYDSRTEGTGNFINELEKKFDRNTGDLYSHTHSQGTGMGLAKFEFDYSNTVALTVNSGSLLSSETFLGAKLTNENYIGVNLSLSTFLGGKISIEGAIAGILETQNLEWETNFPGFKAEGGTNKVGAHISDINNLITEINNGAVKITGSGTDIETTATIKLMA